MQEEVQAQTPEFEMPVPSRELGESYRSQRVSNRDDSYLFEALFDLEALRPLSAGLQQSVVQVRKLFVERLRWTRAQFERYRFEHLYLVSAPVEMAYVALKGPAEYATAMGTMALEMLLQAAADEPSRSSAKAKLLSRISPLKPEVLYRMRPTRALIHPKEQSYIAVLSERVLARKLPSEHGKQSPRIIVEVIMELLEKAYGKEVV